jgi:chromate transport protein ChrA
MQSYFLFFHSILRYFILLFAIVVVVQSLIGMLGKKNLTSTNKRMALFLLICCDLQLLLGLTLYYIKGWLGVLSAGGDVMKDPYKRFWAVEHGLGMIIAIVLVHVGYSFLKKNRSDDQKLKRLFWCSFIALSIFLTTTPWEGKQQVGRPNIPSLR